MSKALCLIHANCQGDELETLLLASSAFARAYDIERYTNYTREDVPEESLSRCSLFLYQQLGSEWSQLSSGYLLSRLPSSAVSLCIPNLFFNGYWPLWTSESPIAYGDSLLNRLIDESASKPAILNIYLNKDLRSFVDMQAVFEQSLAKERAKEQGAKIRVLDRVLEYWQERPLFHTVNHPGRELMLHIAQSVLRELDFPELKQKELSALPELFPSYAEFDLPIHPQVAKFHGLRWVRDGHVYNIFGRSMTFEQYISRYIDCRLNGYADEFLGYLQLV